MKFKVNDYICLNSDELFPCGIYQIDYIFVDLFENNCYVIRATDANDLSYAVCANALEAVAELY